MNTEDALSDEISHTTDDNHEKRSTRLFKDRRTGPIVFLDNNVFLFTYRPLLNCEMKEEIINDREKIVCIWNCRHFENEDDFSFTYGHDVSSIINLFKNLPSFYDINTYIRGLKYSLIIIVYKNNLPNRIYFSVDKEGTYPLYYKVDGKNHVIEICSSDKDDYDVLPEGFMIELRLTDKLEIERFKCSSYI